MQRILQPHLDPGVLLLILIIIMVRLSAYSYQQRPSWPFWIGLLVFSLCAGSPVGLPLMHSYFSIHMIVHVLIILVAAPLIILKPLSPSGEQVVNKGSRENLFVRYPAVGWTLGMASMWFWHIPYIFNLMQTGMDKGEYLLSFMQSCTLLIGGMAFSMPLFGQGATSGGASLGGMVYLFTACITCSLLGLLISFAPTGVFHPGAAFIGMRGMPEENPFHISSEEDRQAAGLIMWVPCCLLYLTGCLYIFYRWFTETDPANVSADALLNIKSSNGNPIS